jgi:TPR repeat protein
LAYFTTTARRPAMRCRRTRLNISVVFPENIEPRTISIDIGSASSSSSFQFAQLMASQRRKKTQPTEMSVGRHSTEDELRCAAERGDAVAQFTLGSRLIYGPPGVERQGISWYRRAAEQGHVEAQYNLGVHLVFGDHVPKDITNGVRWIRLAAEQGLADAQHDLACCYSQGIGMAQDLGKAMYYMRLAAEQGHWRAREHLILAAEKANGR